MMNVNVFFNQINAKLKKGFYIIYNNNFHIIEDINKDNTQVLLSNGESISYGLAEQSVVKFLADVKGKTYSILHGDFKGIIELLNEKIDHTPDEIKHHSQYNTYKEMMIDGIPITFKGLYEPIMNAVFPDNAVSICSLKIIDDNSLYKQADRIGTITKYDKNTRKFTVKLHSTNKDIICKRQDIETIGSPNIKMMVHIECPYCGR